MVKLAIPCAVSGVVLRKNTLLHCLRMSCASDNKHNLCHYSASD